MKAFQVAEDDTDARVFLALMTLIDDRLANRTAGISPGDYESEHREVRRWLAGARRMVADPAVPKNARPIRILMWKALNHAEGLTDESGRAALAPFWDYLDRACRRRDVPRSPLEAIRSSGLDVKRVGDTYYTVSASGKIGREIFEATAQEIELWESEAGGGRPKCPSHRRVSRA